MTRKMVWIGFAWTFGLFFASCMPLGGGVFAGLGIAAIFVGAGLIFRGKVPLKIAAAVISLSVGMVWYGAYEISVYKPAADLAGETLTLKGTVVDYTVYSADRTSYLLKTQKGSWYFSCYGPSTEARYGDELEITAKWEVPSNSLTFPGYSYNRSKGIFLHAYSPKEIVVNAKPGGFLRRVMEYRQWLAESIRREMPGAEGELVLAMFSGQRGGLTEDSKTDFNRVGLGHMMAVSGTHLTIVCGLLLAVFRWLRLDKRLAMGLSIGVGLIFCFFAGMQPSVIRSLLMLFIAYGGRALKRDYDCFSALGFAMVLLTLTNPLAVRDASLLLSCGGVLGIGVLGPFMVSGIEERRLAGDKRAYWYPVGLIRLLLVNAVVFPLSLLFFDEVSLISPFANLLLVPLCTVIMLCGLGAGVAGLFGAAGWEIFGRIALFAGGMVSKVLMKLTGFLADLELAYMPVSDLTAALTLTALAGLLAYWIFHLRKHREWWRRGIAGYLVLSFTLIALAKGAEVTWSNSRLETVVLGNPKGYSIIFKTGGEAVLADYSGDPKAVLANLKRSGIRDVTLLLTSGKYSQESAYMESFAGGGIRLKGLYLPKDYVLRPDQLTHGLLPEFLEDEMSFGPLNITLKEEGLEASFGYSYFSCTDFEGVPLTPASGEIILARDSESGRWRPSQTLSLGRADNNEDEAGAALITSGNGEWRGRRLSYGGAK